MRYQNRDINVDQNPKGSNAKRDTLHVRGNQLAKNASKTLLQNEDVQRWYENSKRSSSLNALVRLRRLNLFCDRVMMTPAKLARVGRGDPMKAENILLDHVSWMEEQNYAPGYTAGMIKAIKSWLQYNHIEIRRKIIVKDSDISVSIQDEQVPEQKQLKEILDSGTPRTRAVISMMAFAGIRPQVMGTADRSDGLRLADLPELVINDKKVAFSKMPAMVVVRQQLSKTRNKYFTFLTEQGCGYVLGYLRHRIAQGEILAPDSPLVTVNAGYDAKGLRKSTKRRDPFMTTISISCSIRDTIWSVMKIRPYALRAYFDTQMLLAESHGCMTHAYRQFFMGHKGDMEARYTTNKGRLTEQMTEDMRRALAQSQMFLSTDSGSAKKDKKEMLLEMWRQQAAMYGVDASMLIQDPKPEQAPSIQKQAKPATGNPFESRIVEDEKSLLEYTAMGWEIVKELADKRWLMRGRWDLTGRRAEAS